MSLSFRLFADKRGQGARATTTIRDDDDSCICFNFRADRVRQITRSLARNSGLNDQWTRPSRCRRSGSGDSSRSRPENLHYVCMTQYDKKFSLPVVIPPESLDNILANVMGQAKMRNLRVAETEKYAHVTYFFNGGVEQPFPGEERTVVPSQKVVGGNFLRGNYRSLFSWERLLYSAVEKIRDVRILLRFRNAQIAHFHLAHDVGEDIVQ